MGHVSLVRGRGGGGGATKVAVIQYLPCVCVCVCVCLYRVCLRVCCGVSFNARESSAATSLATLDDFVPVMLEAEDENYNLFKLINELNREVSTVLNACPLPLSFIGVVVVMNNVMGVENKTTGDTVTACQIERKEKPD